VEDAIQKALTQLNVGLDQVEITVLTPGKSGILGLGAEDAKINVKLRQTAETKDSVTIREARSLLDTLLEKMGFQAETDIETSVEATDEEGEVNPVVFNIVGADVGALIGRRGQTIDAIQYLVRLMLSRKTKSKTPIMIDVEHYRQNRYNDLRVLAINVASQVKSKKTSIRLEPMTAFERRIIHITLAEDPDITTESIGEGESRKVVVSPKLKK
jgi:spoIIIJ-associated protein